VRGELCLWIICGSPAPGPARTLVGITIIGAGAVGQAIAESLVIGNVCADLVLQDVVQDKLKGAVLDFQHGQLFHPCRVAAAEAWTDIANSDIVVITAGVRQRPGESRRALLGRNRRIMEDILPHVQAHCPAAVVIVVSNPCDAMTKMVSEMLAFPEGRVFGSGTFLDSSRFRSLIARRLGVSPSAVHTYVVGEHGDSSVVCFEAGSCGGVPLRDLVDKDTVQDLHTQVINAAQEVIALKGYTNTAIGFAVGKLCSIVLRDAREVAPVSCNVRQVLHLPEDVFLSVPCVLGKGGVLRAMKMALPESEHAKLVQSCNEVLEAEKLAMAEDAEGKE